MSFFKRLLIIFSLTVYAASCSSQENLISLFPIENYDQVVSHWIKPDSPDYDQSLLTEDMAKQHVGRFYNHYFGEVSPWNASYVSQILQLTDEDSIQTVEKSVIAHFDNEGKLVNEIGYGENYRPHDKAWINAIAENINIAQFNQLYYQATQRGIAIDNLAARTLPTEDMHLYSYTIPGQGFPFDNLQVSALWAGTPVYILGETRDKAWVLVLTPDYIAWVKSTGIAKVDEQFVSVWTMAAKSKLGAITQTKTSVITTSGDYLFTAYVGAVFPAIKNEDKLTLLVPAVKDHHAVIKHAVLASNQAAVMPLAATPHRFANVIDSLIGRPYGWGGMYFYNDCSAELKSLLTPFGIWLPRHSSEQVKVGKMVDMSATSAEQRVAYLKENGKRFLTIIYIGGHVVLYVGNSSGNAMVYEDMWGLSPNPPSRRSVVGKSVFMPLLLQFPEDASLVSQAGKKYFQVSYLNEWPTDKSIKLSGERVLINLRALMFPDGQ